MSPLDHDIYLNVYGFTLASRMREYELDSKKRTAASPWPVVGGFADVSTEEISERRADGHPLLDTAIVQGNVVCNHWWKAQGPAKEGQYFCVGWLRSSDCKAGRDPKLDKLDCGFRFDAGQVERREPMYLNATWDRKSTWGLHYAGMTQQQLDSRAAYYRGTTSTNPAWDIIRSLRSAPIILEDYGEFTSKHGATGVLIFITSSPEGDNRAAGVDRMGCFGDIDGQRDATGL
ncbi:unnamed protein product [Peniophora sp. CBMAI 1063]|nr:unnamed protein product [Peniophora sp. CBMAI 1063]